MRLIDADALRQKIRQEMKTLSFSEPKEQGKRLAFQKALLFIKEQPTIEQPKWISCEDKLPTECGPYLVCYRYKKVFTNESFYAVLPFDTFNGTLNWIIPKDVEITHWQPIVPVTYEEAEKPNETD